MSYSKVIYQILKSIDVAFEDETPPTEIFDLEKMGISYRRLCIILKSLYDCGYIDGIVFISGLNGDVPDFKLMCCHLTVDGMLFVEDNTAMKQAYRLLKEAKEWIPGY